MALIPISSCNECKPKLWKSIKEAVGTYLCIKCNKRVYVVLERKE